MLAEEVREIGDQISGVLERELSEISRDDFVVGRNRQSDDDSIIERVLQEPIPSAFELSDRDSVAIDIANLYHAGRRYLPHLAYEVSRWTRDISLVLGLSSEAFGPSELLRTPREVWTDMCGLFVSILRESADNLLDFGDRMVAAADHYRDTEAANAELIAEIDRHLEMHETAWEARAESEQTTIDGAPSTETRPNLGDKEG